MKDEMVEKTKFLTNSWPCASKGISAKARATEWEYTKSINLIDIAKS